MGEKKDSYQGKLANKPTRSAANPKVSATRKATDTSNIESKKLLWIGRVVHVDVESMRCSITAITGNEQWHDVQIPMSGGGPRSFSGSIIERGSMVILGWRAFGMYTQHPVIITCLPPGLYPARSYNPVAVADKNQIDALLSKRPELKYDPNLFLDTVRLKNRKAYEGDYIATSKDGSDILLDRDVMLTSRSGMEIRLRDSDQTSVLNTLNDYVSNAAGSYYRGMIRRGMLSLPQEIYPLSSLTNIPSSYNLRSSGDKRLFNQSVPKSSPAYDYLKEQNLIDADGFRTHSYEQAELEYPSIVDPAGVRTSYVMQGDIGNNPINSLYAYIEDRRELNHVSDGVISVTEEVDGFQIDQKPYYIEDVHGTVVGNDYSGPGRDLYKRILRMNVFDSPKDGSFGVPASLQSLDLSTPDGIELADTMGLARLYRIKSPRTDNVYSFGVSKEGKVFLSVPKTTTGRTSQDLGQSIDASIAGLVKMNIGRDDNTGLSADVRLQGGMNLEIGRDRNRNSLNITLFGPIVWKFLGDDDETSRPTLDWRLGGAANISASSNISTVAGANHLSSAGGRNIAIGSSIEQNAGESGMSIKSLGAANTVILGEASYDHGQSVTCNYAVGKEATTVAGVDKTTVLTGSITRSVVAGTGIDDSVTTGNILTSVVTGLVDTSVTTGSYSVSVKSGALSLAAPVGPVSIQAASTTISSTSLNLFTAPTTAIGTATVGFAVAGIPSPVPGPHIDYLTGIPILGIPTIAIG
jgi:hypothetical protein